MSPNLESQLQNLMNARSSEDQVDWTIFGIFCATTAILLVALFPDGELLSSNIAGFIICFVGFVLSLVWWKIQNRGIKWIDYCEKIISKLEKTLEIQADLTWSPDINSATYNEILKERIHVRDLMVWVPRIIAGLWFLASVYFILIRPFLCK